MITKEYFDKLKNITNLNDLMEVPLVIPNEILDEMPKFRKENIFNKFDYDFLSIQKEELLRQLYIDSGMYGFVSWKWVNPLVEWINGRKVLEVMAGKGWLSHALRLKGVDVIATDNFTWLNERNWGDPLTDIIEEDAVTSIELFGDQVNIIIMSWPYMDNTAFQVLKKIHEVNPSALIVYIGEYYGCTADEEFHQKFDEIEDEKFSNVINNYQSWNIIRDRPFLGKYNDDTDI